MNKKGLGRNIVSSFNWFVLLTSKVFWTKRSYFCKFVILLWKAAQDNGNTENPK